MQKFYFHFQSDNAFPPPNLFFKLVLGSRSNNWDVLTRKEEKKEKKEYCAWMRDRLYVNKTFT